MMMMKKELDIELKVYTFDDFEVCHKSLLEKGFKLLDAFPVKYKSELVIQYEYLHFKDTEGFTIYSQLPN